MSPTKMKLLERSDAKKVPRTVGRHNFASPKPSVAPLQDSSMLHLIPAAFFVKKMDLLLSDRLCSSFSPGSGDLGEVLDFGDAADSGGTDGGSSFGGGASVKDVGSWTSIG